MLVVGYHNRITVATLLFMGASITAAIVIAFLLWGECSAPCICASLLHSSTTYAQHFSFLCVAIVLACLPCRMGVYALVIADHVNGKGANAKEWCDACTGAVGKGRGGGRADMANANIPLTTSDNAESVTQTVLNAARTYWASKN
jgi:hypothetical protein